MPAATSGQFNRFHSASGNTGAATWAGPAQPMSMEHGPVPCPAKYTIYLGQIFAMSVISLAPVVGFFIAGQKYLVKGIATTGLKG
jgi:ABC-type glycerol-3-phosphate transport system permease component